MPNFKKYIPQRFINFYHLFIAILANIYYGYPSKKIKIIGVTGTKGKTTTSCYLQQILNTKYPTGVICTTGIKIGDYQNDSTFHVTTPSPFTLQKYIRLAVNQKLEWLVIETSSHGFDQNRLWGINFDISIVTNIFSDHLDYHHTWENYALAKSKIITQLKPNGLAFLNIDDKKSYTYLSNIAKKLNKKVVNYGTKNTKAIISAKIISSSISGIKFKFHSHIYLLNAFGDFNLYNILPTLYIANLLKINQKDIKFTLKNIQNPPGRMEIIHKNPYVIIDFAHNQMSLEIALKNLLPLKGIPENKLISVFGCPGLRDKKRRIMGKISAKYSDLTIITTDDPRTEGVENISSEIENWAIEGKAIPFDFSKNIKFISNKHYYLKINDRKKAIATALKLATKQDIVYITGMGHQKTIAINNIEIPWSDKETTKSLLSTRS